MGWVNHIRDLKYKYKIMVGCILCCLICIAVLWSYTVHETHSLLTQRSLLDMENQLQQSAAALDHQLQLCDNALGSLSINNSVISAAEHEYTGYYEMYDIFSNQVTPLFSSVLTFNGDIAQLTLYSASNVERHTPWVLPTDELSETIRLQGENRWIYDTDQGVCKLQKLASSCGENYLYIQLHDDVLERLFGSLSSQGYGVTLFDSCGNVAYDVPPNGLTSVFFTANSGKHTGQIWEQDGFFCSCRTVESSGWTIYLYQSKGYFWNRNWQMVPGLIGISVVCLMAAVLTSLLLSRLAVTRIENLAANIRQLREGQNEIWVQSKSKDEIGYLTDEFITMMQLIQHLIKDVYQEQLIRKEYQIQMLRAQINPHFLYNTLSAIRWKTLMNGDEEASEIINQLSVFYRTALNKGREFSNVENEMKNIRAYITIQKELQSHLFQVSYHVDSSLYPCKIPVMILQPIVENAILHGLASSRKQDRSLSLSAFGKGRDMIFEIRDDGAGIEAEQLKQLLNSKTNGYGMKNVQERIHLLYGNEYGLEIHSIRGEGTIVRVLLPKEPLTDVEN